MDARLGQDNCPNHINEVFALMRPVNRVSARACNLLMLTLTAILSACGSPSPEGKPVAMPNYSPIQKYLASISHAGQNFRVFSCIAESPVRYIIVFPNNSNDGLLLINVDTVFPKVETVNLNGKSKLWEIKELPNTGEPYKGLSAAKYFVTISDDHVIRSTFDRIMSSHPQFSIYNDVTPTSLLLVPSRSLCTSTPPHPFDEWSHQRATTTHSSGSTSGVP